MKRFVKLSAGEQAIVGYVTEDNASAACTNKLIKVAKEIGGQMIHEYLVGKAINSLKLHNTSKEEQSNIGSPTTGFLQTGELITLWASEDAIKLSEQDEDIWLEEKPNTVPVWGLEMEYIRDSIVLTDWLKKKRSKEEIYSVLLEVLGNIRLARESIGFTHYDLHVDNVLMRKRVIGDGTARIYKFKDGSNIFVQLKEWEPVIIDYGRAFVNSLLGQPTNMELFNTEAGVLTVCSHPTYDWLFFLNSAAQVLKHHGHRSLEYKLRQYTIHLDSSGWLHIDEPSAATILISCIRSKCSESNLFSRYLSYSLNILLQLAILPHERMECGESGDLALWTYYFIRFLKYWVTLERWVERSTRRLHLLQFLVANINNYRAKYLDPDTRSEAIASLAKAVTEYMDIECEDQWDANVNWPELFRTAILTGRTAESCLAKVLKRQIELSYKLTNIDNFKLLNIIKLDAVEPTKLPRVCETFAAIRGGGEEVVESGGSPTA